MARIASTGGTYLYATGLTFNVSALSISAWLKKSATTATHRGVAVTNFSSDYDGAALYSFSSEWYSWLTSGSATDTASTSVSTTDWVHLCGTFNAGTNTLYRNGSYAAQDTYTSALYTNLESVLLGARNYNGTIQYGSGTCLFGHVSYYGGVLSAEDVAAIAAGVPVRDIRPDLLLHYYPLLTGDGNLDYWGNADLSYNSGSLTETTDDPPVQMSDDSDIILINQQPAASTRKWLFNIDAGEWFTTSSGCAFSTVYNRMCLVFDNADQIAYSPCFRVPSGFGGGTVTAEICYALATDTTTTHVAKFNVAIECISDGDATDTDAAEYLGADNRICGMVPATAGYMKTCRATMKDNDSMAAGDCCRLRLTRAGTDTEDTATGDVRVFWVAIYEA